MSQDFTGEQDNIGFAILDDIVRLGWVGDQAHGGYEDVRDVLLDMRGEWDLCGSAISLKR